MSIRSIFSLNQNTLDRLKIAHSCMQNDLSCWCNKIDTSPIEQMDSVLYTKKNDTKKLMIQNKAIRWCKSNGIDWRKNTHVIVNPYSDRFIMNLVYISWANHPAWFLLLFLWSDLNFFFRWERGRAHKSSNQYISTYHTESGFFSRKLIQVHKPFAIQISKSSDNINKVNTLQWYIFDHPTRTSEWKEWNRIVHRFDTPHNANDKIRRRSPSLSSKRAQNKTDEAKQQ